MTDRDARSLGRAVAWLPWGLVGAVVAYLLLDLGRLPFPGFDEASIGLEALRCADLLRNGQIAEAFDRCQLATFYPPLGWFGPMVAFTAFGPSWFAARAATVLAFGATLLLTSRLARRLVEPARADAAAVASIVLSLGSYLAVDLGSIAMLESWTSLALAGIALLVVRAHERRARGAALAAGLALGAMTLVKYNYAVLALLAVGGAEGFGLLRSWARREPAREGPLPVLAWIALGAAVVPLWWFFWPFPASIELGERHRQIAFSWLGFSWGIAGLTAREFLYVYPILASGSLVSLALQVGGFARALSRLDALPQRLCALLAAGGLAAVLTYEHREARFLLPTLFAAWALAGAFAALLVDRLRLASRGARAGALATLLALALGTAGLGAPALAAFASNDEEYGRGLGERIARKVREPWNAHKLPAGTSDGREAILAAAARQIDLRRPFTWLTGAATDFARPAVVWYLFARSGERALLETGTQDAEELMNFQNWGRVQFYEWVVRYPQVVVVDPPFVSETSPYSYEWLYMQWMAYHPNYRERSREAVALPEGERAVVVYERAP